MISGKGLSGVIGVAAIAGCYKWDCEESGVELDNATSGSGGFENPEIGLTGLSATIHGYFDVGISSLTGLRVGAAVVDLQLFATSTALGAGLMATIPLGIVTKLSLSAEVRGKIDFNATVKSKGSYSLQDATA